MKWVGVGQLLLSAGWGGWWTVRRPAGSAGQVCAISSSGDPVLFCAFNTFVLVIIRVVTFSAEAAADSVGQM